MYFFPVLSNSLEPRQDHSFNTQLFRARLFLNVRENMTCFLFQIHSYFNKVGGYLYNEVLRLR